MTRLLLSIIGAAAAAIITTFALLNPYTEAIASPTDFQFVSKANESRCAGRSAANPTVAKTLPCTDQNTQFVFAEFSDCGFTFNGPMVCKGRLRIYGTNSCLYASSSTTVVFNSCGTGNLWQWRYNYETALITNVQYGINIAVFYDIAVNKLKLTNTSLGDPTRRWFLKP